MKIKIDRHTDLINWIASAFDENFSGYLAQVHKYNDYRPEPEIRLRDGRIKTPDIVAVNYDKQIVLVIECKGGIEEELREKFGAELDTEKIKKQIDDYANVLWESLTKYFQKLKAEGMVDVVVATYPDLLNEFKKIKNHVDKKQRALWIFDNKGKKIYKHFGIHTDKALNECLSPTIGVPLRPYYPSIINFSRHSNKDHIAAEGLIRLLQHAICYSDFDFTIDKIDKILSGEMYGKHNSMPLLWQMNKDERYSRWRYMVAKAIENKWMREVEPGVYRFLNIHTGRDLDDNVTKILLGTMIRRIKETCGLHG